MDLNYSAEETAFRDEVRGWLSENLPTELRDKVVNYQELSKDDLLRWHKILAKKGWVAPDWPTEWGGTDWNVVQRYIFEEECGYAGTPPLIPFGLRMCAPVLLRFGTDAQKKRFLPRIYKGEDFWCQGYSEPGSGSRPGVAEDARGRGRAITTWSPARRSGPRSAHYADWIFCLVRTDAKTRQAPGGHLVPAHRHEDAGHHRAADHPDGRRPRGERGLLRRGEGARREPRARGGQGLDGGQVPARPRAHGHRPHRRLQARAGHAQGGGRAPAARTASPSSTTRASATGSRAWRSS